MPGRFFKSIILMNLYLPSITSAAARGLAMAAIVAFGSASAMADEPIVRGNENREIIPGVEYLIPSFQTSSGYYTAPQAGRVQIVGAQDFVPYYDINHTENIITNNLDNTGHMKWFEVEEG